MLRSHTCGELRASHTKTEVTLCGWVHRRRDHGGLIFIDLRDRYGITQVVIAPETKDAFAAAEAVRSEWVLKITGTVRDCGSTIRPIDTRLPSALGGSAPAFNSAPLI